MEKFIICCIVLVVFTIGYFLFVFMWAKRATAIAPHVDYYTCDTHGPIPVSLCIQVPFGEEYETSEGRADHFTMCPNCYDDRMKATEAKIKALK